MSYIYIWMQRIVAVVALHTLVQCQTFQDTPIYNVVKNIPVSQTSSDTCTTYCKSRGTPCVEETCDFSCPLGDFGSVLKSNPLEGASKGTGCAGHTSSQGFSKKGTIDDYTFFNSSSTPSCVVTSTVTTNGYFAVGFWIIADGITCDKPPDCYVDVLTISDESQQDLLKIRIGEGSVEVGLKAGSTHPISTDLSQWNHFTVQFTNSTITVIKNGQISLDSEGFFSQIMKNDPANRITFTIGSNTGFDKGGFAVSDLIVLGGAVGGRELLSLSGQETTPRVGPKCSCSFTFLLEKDRICSTLDRVSTRSRLNERAHYLEYINDGVEETSWVSPHQDRSTLRFSLTDSFQILNMSIAFATTIPLRLSVQLLWSGEVASTRNMTVAPSFSSEISVQFDVTGYNTKRSTYMKTLADEIILTLEGHQSVAPWDYHSVSEVKAMGRLACFGSPVSSTSMEPNFKCDCEEKSEGNSCENCKQSNYRVDEFLCNSCGCNSTGSANSNCDLVSGNCSCKNNIVGMKCNQCAVFHYNLTSTGCKPCGCNMTGSSGCDMSSGACACKTGVSGASCDSCKLRHFGHSQSGCTPCGCVEDSASTTCDSTTGECKCNGNVAGGNCVCSSTYWGFPFCKPCPKCNPNGLAPGRICDGTNGKCRCAGGVDSLRCDPDISGMTPMYGPVAGGTLVTVTGQLLGKLPGFTVYINDVMQKSVRRNHSTLVFSTLGNPIPLTAGRVEIGISDNITEKIILSQEFEYRPNPTVSSFSTKTAFVSGGTPLIVKGANLNSVYQPVLLVYSANGSVQLNATEEICISLSQNSLQCPSPNLEDHFSEAGGTVRLGLIFDGLTAYKVLLQITGTLTVFPNPTVNPWKEEMAYTYPFNNRIEITGAKFNQAASQSDYSILIGELDCRISFFSSSLIRCIPPSFPNREESLETKVVVGNFEFIVGSLKYIPFYKNVIFIGIVAGLGVLLLAIIVIIILCKRRHHKSFDQTKTKKNAQSKEGYLVPVPKDTGNSDGADPEAAGNKYTKLTLAPPPLARVEPTPTEFMEPGPTLPSKKAPNDSLPVPLTIGVKSDTDKKHSNETLMDRMDVYSQDILWEALVDHNHVIPGKICTKKGIVSRLIDGEFSKTSTILPGHKLSIKTLVNVIKDEEPIPDWLTKAAIASMSFISCEHENILQSLGVCFDEGKVYILYPYMVNRTLKEFLVNIEQELSVVQMIEFSSQIGDGMKFLADKGIEHKDLAARNCMIDKNLVVKVSDSSFGDDLYQNEYAFDSDRMCYYPLRWMAEESLTTGFHDIKSQVWSFGIVMWELFTRGAMPYFDTEDSGVLSLLQSGSRPGKPECMPDDLDELMTSCWNEQSDNRPTFMEITKKFKKTLTSSRRPVSIESFGNEYDDPIYGNISVGIQPIFSTRRL